MTNDEWIVSIERTEWWGPIRYYITYTRGWKKFPPEFAFTRRGAIRRALRTMLRYSRRA